MSLTLQREVRTLTSLETEILGGRLKILMMVPFLSFLFMGGCNPLVGDVEERIKKEFLVTINDRGGYFKNNGSGRFSFSGRCQGDGEVSYRVGVGTEQTVPCRDGMWEVSNIVPMLDDGSGGGRPAGDGDQVPVEVSLNGSRRNEILTVDTSAPLVESLTPPSNGTYARGSLDFVVRFGENVFMETNSGIAHFNMILDSWGRDGPIFWGIGNQGTHLPL